MEVLVTGGGGFLGNAIVECLLAEGFKVRSFARGDYPELRKKGVTVLRGDLVDIEAVKNACEGCDVVFHCAARAGVWGDYMSFYLPNVIGTKNVIEACRSVGVSRLVYTSSASVVFGDEDLEGVDETVPYPDRHRSFYTATKAEAEQMVLRANDQDLKTIALRPHLVWGPGDTQIIPRIIARALKRRIVRIGDGRNVVDTTYVDNAAYAHLLAARALDENPRVRGRAYFITNGEPVNLWQFVNRILELAGIPPVRRGVSQKVGVLLGLVVEGFFRVFRIEGEPFITRFLAEELSTSHWFDISAAQRDLNYKPLISIEEGLKKLALWMEKEGLTKKG
ncbi:MAG: NAD-dependent epimerase/dehydratase family protein [Syntrophales bacterium]|nr:NAD-dependent epimerase/dehydratase family protein [Syntrophales bacterium]